MQTQSFIQDLASDFEHLSQNFPTITSIKPQSSSNDSKIFRVNYLHPNYRESTFHNASYLFSFNPKETTPIQKLSEFSALEGFITAESFSPSKNFRAIIRSSPEKILLEVWGKTGLQKSLKISDYHGAVFSELEFTIETLTWSADEKRIMYLAQKKTPRAPKLFDHFNNEAEAKKALNNFGYEEDFGEMFSGKSDPAIFIFDFEDDQLYQVLNIPDDVVPSQVSFTDQHGSSLVFCGYHFKDIKLGMKFTANRPAKIYSISQLALKGLRPPRKGTFKTSESSPQEIQKPILLSGDDGIALAPIVSPDFTKLIYLFSEKKITIMLHFGIKVIDLLGGKPSSEIKPQILFEIPKDNTQEFLGVTTYQNRLTRWRFLSNSNYFVFNSYQRSSLGLFLGNLQTKEIKRLDQTRFKSGECRLDAIDGDTIFASFSNIANERNFGVFSGLDSSISNSADALSNAKWFMYDFVPELSARVDPHVNSSLTSIGEIEEKILLVNGAESLFFSLKDTAAQNAKKPLILFLHGGPHGISTGFFSMMMYYALYRGYNVLYPNFTGTTGFGQKSEEKLLGKIGELDAEEVKATLEYCGNNGLADTQRMIVVGLSYGGYLTGVMLAKYPTLYKLAILQNPVASMVGMHETSDVPDWPLAEVLGIETPSEITGDMYKRMFEVSPLGMNKDLKTRILLMVGRKDRRIPLDSSLLYYRLLKAKGVDIQIALYPNDEHVLSGTPDSIVDQFVRTFAFIDEKLELN